MKEVGDKMRAGNTRMVMTDADWEQVRELGRLRKAPLPQGVEHFTISDKPAKGYILIEHDIPDVAASVVNVPCGTLVNEEWARIDATINAIKLLASMLGQGTKVATEPFDLKVMMTEAGKRLGL